MQIEIKLNRPYKQSLFSKHFKFLSLALENLGKDHIFKFVIELSYKLCKLGYYEQSIPYMNISIQNSNG